MTYAEAVTQLVKVTQFGSGGSKVAAQVLLSAYNGHVFRLNVGWLGILDRNNLEAAMTVIRCRTETGTEPHTVIPNGQEVFEDLCRVWSDLRCIEDYP